MLITLSIQAFVRSQISPLTLQASYEYKWTIKLTGLYDTVRYGQDYPWVETKSKHNLRVSLFLPIGLLEWTVIEIIGVLSETK